MVSWENAARAARRAEVRNQRPVKPVLTRVKREEEREWQRKTNALIDLSKRVYYKTPVQRGFFMAWLAEETGKRHRLSGKRCPYMSYS